MPKLNHILRNVTYLSGMEIRDMDEALKKAEGIILHMVPYRNYDQILTVFTENQGVIKLFCKKERTPWHRFTPLTKIECVYREGKSELCPCEDISLLDSYLSLRNHLVHLEAGCHLIQSIYKSQLLDREAAPLYQLLIYYLDRIPELSDPYLLVISFKLKILQYEGLLNLSVSNSQLSTDQYELDQLHVLAYGRSYRDISQLTVSDELKAKIDAFFLAMNSHSLL